MKPKDAVLVRQLAALFAPCKCRVTPAEQSAFEQYAAEMARRARMDREIAILKVAAPGVCAMDENDLTALAEVFHG